MAVAEKNAPSRREEIVDTATNVFLDKGFAATSMSQLAAACGIQKASFYHHFRNKEDLFVACVNHGYAAALDAVEELKSRGDLSAVDKFSQAVELLYAITVNSPAGRLAPLIAEVSRSMPETAERFFGDYIAIQRGNFEDIVMQGVDAGMFTKPDFDVLYHLLFGPVVTLSLSREMFATMEDFEQRFPVAKVRDGHIQTLLVFLAAPV